MPGPTLWEADGIRYRVTSPGEDLPAILEVLASSFVEEPVSQTLGVTAAQLMQLYTRLGDAMCSDLGVVAVDISGAGVGALVVRDGTYKIPVSVVQEYLRLGCGPIFAAQDETEAPFHKTHPNPKPGEVAVFRLLAVQQRFRGLQIGRRLLETASRQLRQRGYRVATMHANSEFTARIASRLGWTVVSEIEYQTWVHQGNPPLAAVQPPHNKLRFVMVDLQ
eukprot:RCo018945